MKYKPGMSFLIDGENVLYFRKIICMNGEVRHQFSDNILSGYPSHEIKDNQLREMLACRRIQRPTPRALDSAVVCAICSSLAVRSNGYCAVCDDPLSQ